jgi:hypothetical protein
MDGDPSFSWARTTALPRAEALIELDRLRAACTATQLALRSEAFPKARRFIEAGAVEVEYVPIYRVFRNRNLPKLHKDSRVDVDVMRGSAFV